MNSLLLETAVKTESLFSEEELALLSKARIPEHVAIMMDGNRRWANNNNLPFQVGHWKGAEVLTKIVRAASALGIKVLTVFAFSTENWKRSPNEINELMRLFKLYLIRQRALMIEEGVKLDVIGEIARLPPDVQEALEETRQATKEGSKIELVLALNYGGRDDIRRAFQSLASDCAAGRLSCDQITEETISSYLDTGRWRDPALIIRTSGEQRLSNFLLWQASYSEIYVTNVFWPDFTPNHLLDALLSFQQRDRRHGK